MVLVGLNPAVLLGCYGAALIGWWFSVHPSKDRTRNSFITGLKEQGTQWEAKSSVRESSQWSVFLRSPWQQMTPIIYKINPWLTVGSASQQVNSFSGVTSNEIVLGVCRNKEFWSLVMAIQPFAGSIWKSLVSTPKSRSCKHISGWTNNWWLGKRENQRV